MMPEHKVYHHNYLRARNFKRFKDLEVKDMGLFNLTVGDNNVWKTSLLEAFYQRILGFNKPFLEPLVKFLSTYFQ